MKHAQWHQKSISSASQALSSADLLELLRELSHRATAYSTKIEKREVMKVMVDQFIAFDQHGNAGRNAITEQNGFISKHLEFQSAARRKHWDEYADGSTVENRNKIIELMNFESVLDGSNIQMEMEPEPQYIDWAY